jgi:hypothetical protein
MQPTSTTHLILDRANLIARYQRIRKRSRALFDVVFYEGRFSFNTLANSLKRTPPDYQPRANRSAPEPARADTRGSTLT